MSSYNRFARYTFKTPDGQHFVMDARTKSRKANTLQRADKVAKTRVRSEYERWSAAKTRKETTRTRYTAPTLWTVTISASLQTRSRARRTIGGRAEDRGAGRAKTRSKTGAEEADAAAKRKASETLEDERATKKAQHGENSERKAKRKATWATDGYRAAKKVKTQHVAGILDVPGSEGVEQVWVLMC
ncbi:hypothetical protein K466DRAFT_656097 [Polyporus arcularius HHB13444]|uniref:Uncharacterized protein n=1 Tax=Polyporus arcularius HHB13444 TaxID=1314778 RepID=A0A5C3NYY3_9APHY|nr:hypothetical protein K466DRAFT_656097 [Polyporus arcularius HHB13444]